MDRLKYRVWDKSEESYFTQDDFTIYLEPNAKLQIIGTGFDGEDCFFETKNAVIEQCTGLKDKNGNLIYEGDILKITGQGIDDIVKVYWENGMYCFSISPNSANLVFFDLSDNETTSEIIGNIHENADLLGEE